MSGPSEVTDLVVGCITDYDIGGVELWINSLAASGYVGDTVMIVYNADVAVVEYLLDRGLLVIGFEFDTTSAQFRFPDSVGEQILVSRFFHLWCLLREGLGRPIRYVISADVKDVVFQRNPADWLAAHLGDKQMNVGSESVRFAGEPWGSEVMKVAFDSEVGRFMEDKTIYNAGTMAGTFAAMRDFALQVYLVASGRPRDPDQAAANILLALHPFRSITRFNSSEDGWACQLGTTVAASYITGTNLSIDEPRPVFDGHQLLTNGGLPFCLVHQYDRVPEIQNALRERYNQHPPRANRGQLVLRPEWRLIRTGLSRHA